MGQIRANTSKIAKNRKISKLIKMVWESLESHLESAESEVKLTASEKRKVGEGFGSKKFHQGCVKDYAEQIKLLSELYG